MTEVAKPGRITPTFEDGVAIGLRAAAAMLTRGMVDAEPHARIEREAYRIEALMKASATSRPVDSEAEWQSWMIELELGNWDRTLADGKQPEVNGR